MSKIKTLTKAEKFNNALNKKNISIETETDKYIDDILETKKSKDDNKKDVRTKELEYKKLELRDQILLRPDTYIGSVKKINHLILFGFLEIKELFKRMYVIQKVLLDYL